jgi:hypothetical protein
MPKVVGIAWATHSNRLDEIVAGLDGESEKISFLSGRKFLAPIRYLYLGIRTIQILRREGAEVVIAQNPPIFCPYFSHLYTRLYGGKLVVDSHSLAMDRAEESSLWRMISRIERNVLRKSFLNTVINEAYGSVLKEKGIGSLVLYDAPPTMPKAEKELKRDPLRIICPLGGHPDEDTDSLLRLADTASGIELLVTGRWDGAKHHPKINYRGFLPRDEYLRAIATSDIGLCLLKGNEMTLPYVLFEFASAELPFIVTRTRATAELGDAFLVSDEEELKRKVESLKDEQNYMKMVENVRALKETMLRKSREGRDCLRQLLMAKTE